MFLSWCKDRCRKNESRSALLKDRRSCSTGDGKILKSRNTSNRSVCRITQWSPCEFLGLERKLKRWSSILRKTEFPIATVSKSSTFSHRRFRRNSLGCLGSFYKISCLYGSRRNSLKWFSLFVKNRLLRTSLRRSWTRPSRRFKNDLSRGTNSTSTPTLFAQRKPLKTSLWKETLCTLRLSNARDHLPSIGSGRHPSRKRMLAVVLSRTWHAAWRANAQ